MATASKRLPAGAGLAPALVRRAAFVVLDWDTRQKSRFHSVDSDGRPLGVFLPRGTVLRGGDVQVRDDGGLVAVRALPQRVLVVSVASCGTPLDLLRAAYHLGNRHVPLEVRADRLQLEPDHVLAALLRRMGLRVDEAEAPFEPEGGAYDATHAHGPGHRHDHGHDHHDGHDHAHGQAHGHADHGRPTP